MLRKRESCLACRLVRLLLPLQRVSEGEWGGDGEEGPAWSVVPWSVQIDQYLLDLVLRGIGRDTENIVVLCVSRHGEEDKTSDSEGGLG